MLIYVKIVEKEIKIPTKIPTIILGKLKAGMRVFLRGKTYWAEFKIDKKRYQFSTKSKDKRQAEEIASSIHSDIIRNKFNIPSKYKAEFMFEEVWLEYLKGLSNTPAGIESKICSGKHFLPIFKDKNVGEIDGGDIKAYQLNRKNEIRERTQGNASRKYRLEL